MPSLLWSRTYRTPRADTKDASSLAVRAPRAPRDCASPRHVAVANAPPHGAPAAAAAASPAAAPSTPRQDSSPWAKPAMTGAPRSMGEGDAAEMGCRGDFDDVYETGTELGAGAFGQVRRIGLREVVEGLHRGQSLAVAFGRRVEAHATALQLNQQHAAGSLSGPHAAELVAATHAACSRGCRPPRRRRAFPGLPAQRTARRAIGAGTDAHLC
eukprot:359831-Chlamydomonas_euryale.AAC.4